MKLSISSLAGAAEVAHVIVDLPPSYVAAPDSQMVIEVRCTGRRSLMQAAR